MPFAACLLLRLLLGVKRTRRFATHMSANDPKRTLFLKSLRLVLHQLHRARQLTQPRRRLPHEESSTLGNLVWSYQPLKLLSDLRWISGGPGSQSRYRSTALTTQRFPYRSTILLNEHFNCFDAQKLPLSAFSKDASCETARCQCSNRDPSRVFLLCSTAASASVSDGVHGSGWICMF